MTWRERAEKLAEQAATFECLATDHKEVDGVGFHCFMSGFEAGRNDAREEAKALVEVLEKITNNIGQDALQVQHETVWGDPKNVSDNLDQSQENMERWFGQLREALTQYRESVKRDKA